MVASASQQEAPAQSTSSSSSSLGKNDEKLVSFVVSKMRSVEASYEELAARLQDPAIANDVDEMTRVNKAMAAMQASVDAFREYEGLVAEEAEARAMARDAASAGDAELQEMAREEAADIAQRLRALEESMLVLLLPRDPCDDKNIMLEVRAGTGGDEACIWAGDLIRMYQMFCEKEGWRCDVVSAAPGDTGGVRESVLEVTASKNAASSDVFSKLKFEAGVHRVQRVPATETKGRVVSPFSFPSLSFPSLLFPSFLSFLQ